MTDRGSGGSPLPKGFAGRRWVHAHEEDTATTEVFRPATTPLPPARGRYAFEMFEGGRLVERPLARDDAPRDRDGTWRVGADGTIRFFEAGRAEPTRRLRVVAVTNDRLVVDA